MVTVDEDEEESEYEIADIPEYDDGTAYGCDKCGDCEDWLDIEANNFHDYESGD